MPLLPLGLWRRADGRSDMGWRWVERGSGRPLVLLHGLGLQAPPWDLVIGRLARTAGSSPSTCRGLGGPESGGGAQSGRICVAVARNSLRHAGSARGRTWLGTRWVRSRPLYESASGIGETGAVHDVRSLTGQAMARDGLAGVAVAMVRPGEPLAVDCAGVADTPTASPVGPGTVFRIASVDRRSPGHNRAAPKATRRQCAYPCCRPRTNARRTVNRCIPHQASLLS
jgi:Beta-lactamase